MIINRRTNPKNTRRSAPVVYLVDDDEDFLNSLVWLLKSVPFEVEAFTSPDQFLAHLSPQNNTTTVAGPAAQGCIVTDLRMPGTSGLELQAILRERNVVLPFIIMTAHGDVDSAVRAIKGGAFDFIQKPFNDQVFIDLVNKAMRLNAAQIDENQNLSAARARMLRLTPRENEVLNLVVEGMTNKVIAANLGISEKTVETHRSKIGEKMGVRGLAELIKTVVTLRHSK